MTHKKKILFVTYGGGHVNMCVPVINRLRQSGDWDVMVLGMTTARSVLDRLGIPAFGFQEMLFDADNDAVGYGARLANALPPDGPVTLEESRAYLGINYSDLVATYGEDEAGRLYAEKDRQCFFPVRAMQRLLARLKPDVVVATNSPRAERAAIIAAQNLNIPALCMVDLFATHEVEWLGQSGYANRVCVLSAAVRDFLVSHGRNAEEITITGNPAFDSLFDARVKQLGAELRIASAWNDGKVNLLWASQVEPLQHPFADRQGDPALPRRIEQVLRRFVVDNPRFRLIVRYHPSERVEFVEQDGVVYSPSSESLQSLLHAIDGVVVTSSTVGLEASLVGLPVVSVDASIFTEDAPYSVMGVSVGVDSPDDLPKKLKQIFPGDGVFWPRTPGADGNDDRSVQGRSTENVIEVIESMFLMFPRGIECEHNS